jgi:alpha-tubulin suppressor-like RCC1 family protein
MSSSRAADRKKERERVVKIAATKENVLALKANGEVWSGSTHGQWEYVSEPQPPQFLFPF